MTLDRFGQIGQTNISGKSIEMESFSVLVDPELTEEAWLDSVFCRIPDMKPMGMNKWRYMADHLKDYFKWLEDKKIQHREFAFTLTTDITDPSRFAGEEEAMVSAVGKILTQQTCPIIDGEAYLEYQASGAPHIHGWYRCDKGHRIYSKIFKRYWSLWDEKVKCGNGHKGGYHKEMKTNRYKGYQSAEGRKVF